LHDVEKATAAARRGLGLSCTADHRCGGRATYKLKAERSYSYILPSIARAEKCVPGNVCMEYKLPQFNLFISSYPCRP
jgi:hypothetical protein